MASLSKYEILIGNYFSIGRGLNGVQSKPWESSATINILFLVQVGDSACFTKHCSYTLFHPPFLLCTLVSHYTTFTDHPCILWVVTAVNSPFSTWTITKVWLRSSAVDIVQPNLLLGRTTTELSKGCHCGLHNRIFLWNTGWFSVFRQECYYTKWSTGCTINRTTLPYTDL